MVRRLIVAIASSQPDADAHVGVRLG